ncbi:MAG: DUF5119 domain-containing protein [Bacteroidales bacterium]|nr:DUF5119 domain-containing protein [Bacteroidales bacterium]
MSKIIRILLLMVLLVSASCQRKLLQEPHEHRNLIIKAHFDSLGRAQLMSNKSSYAPLGTPASTKYVLYDKFAGKVAYTGSFEGIEGGMYVEEGLYDLLVYTTDFNEYDANFFRGMDNPLTAETYTRQTSKHDNDFGVTEMNMVEPDPTFAVLQEDVVVLHGYEDNVVEVQLVQKSFKYYLTIKALGLHNIHTAKMNISGMYTSAYLAHEDHRMDEAGTQTVEMDIHYDTNPDESIDNGYLYGEFWAFGPNQREDILNSIILYFVNGDVIRRELDDLTAQIKTLDKGGEIIVTQVLEIKGPAGGFEPGVGDWDDPTDVEIIL